MKYPVLPLLTAAAATLALAACNKPASPPTSAPASTVTTTSAAPAALTGDAAILAAAEPFEKLTETAFSETLAGLDKTVIEVRSAAAGVRGSLPAAAAARLDQNLAAIDAARASDNRAGIAIAAVEGYRSLVTAVSPGTKVPTAVNLLDYAGFRYDAGHKAKPANWDDMAKAVTFGDDQWASLSPNVADSALNADVTKVLSDMKTAATGRNAVAAAAAAQRELALVDKLEAYFKAK